MSYVNKLFLAVKVGKIRLILPENTAIMIKGPPFSGVFRQWMGFLKFSIGDTGEGT